MSYFGKVIRFLSHFGTQHTHIMSHFGNYSHFGNVSTIKFYFVELFCNVLSDSYISVDKRLQTASDSHFGNDSYSHFGTKWGLSTKCWRMLSLQDQIFNSDYSHFGTRYGMGSELIWDRFPFWESLNLNTNTWNVIITMLMLCKPMTWDASPRQKAKKLNASRMIRDPGVVEVDRLSFGWMIAWEGREPNHSNYIPRKYHPLLKRASKIEVSCQTFTILKKNLTSCKFGQSHFFGFKNSNVDNSCWQLKFMLSQNGNIPKYRRKRLFLRRFCDG